MSILLNSGARELQRFAIPISDVKVSQKFSIDMYRYLCEKYQYRYRYQYHYLFYITLQFRKFFERNISNVLETLTTNF